MWYFIYQVWTFHSDLSCILRVRAASLSWGRAHSTASINRSADICCDLVTGTLHHGDTLEPFLMKLKPSCKTCCCSCSCCCCKWNVVQRWEGTFAGTFYNNLFCSPWCCCSFHCAKENNNEHVAINSHLCRRSCFMEQLPPQDGCKGKEAESGSISFPSWIRLMSHKQAGVWGTTRWTGDVALVRNGFWRINPVLRPLPILASFQTSGTLFSLSTAAVIRILSQVPNIKIHKNFKKWGNTDNETI